MVVFAVVPLGGPTIDFLPFISLKKCLGWYLSKKYFRNKNVTDPSTYTKVMLMITMLFVVYFAQL